MAAFKQKSLLVEESYMMMNELRRALKLHSYEYRDKDGTLKVQLILNYMTADNKIHQVANTEITL